MQTMLLRKLKKFAGLFLKLALAGGIVAFLIARNPKEIIEGFSNFNYIYLIPALFFYGSHIFVCSFRWYELAKIINVKLSMFEALSLTWQGYFFSLVIPGGAIGGDVVKMGVLSRRTAKGEKLEGAFSILMDRIIGMIALFLIVLLILGPAVPLLLKIQVPEVTLSESVIYLWIIALAGLCLAGLGASLAVFFHRFFFALPLIGPMMRWGDKLTKGMITRMTAATDIYKKSTGKLTLLTIVSIFFVHLMCVLVFYFLMQGVGCTNDITILNLVAAVAIGNVVGLIPIFPAGVGGRDVATITILVAAGLSAGEAKTGQLIYTAIVIAFNLIGGLFFILDPGRKQIEETIKEFEAKK